MGTLAYGGSGNHGALLIREKLGACSRDLCGRRGGKSFLYAWVAEWHNTDQTDATEAKYTTAEAISKR